ncbi:MAG: PAS domain S-box protein [Rhizobiaceae bacterium]|nr:PAS domain S-box protein [Rhizobiaceae bacterium]
MDADSLPSRPGPDASSLLEDLAENAPAMLWAGDAEGKCTYLNRAMREFWGVGDNLAGFDWNATLHPDDVEKLREPFVTGMTNRTAFTVEARYRRADGEYRVMRTEARPRFAGPEGAFLGMYGTNVDITDVLDARHEAADSGKLKNAILDAALDAIVTVDHRGRFIEFNEAAERIFGHEREAVLGQAMDGLIVPENMRGAHGAGMKSYLETGVSKVLGRRLELPALRADGTEFPAEIAIVRIADTEPPIFTAFVRDITARKRWEEQVRVLMGELNHRTKNLLSVVRAVAAQTARQTGPERFMETFSQRLSSLAASNDLLVEASWRRVSLAALTRAQLQHVGGMLGTRILVDGPAEELSPGNAQTLGMALHELATNSLKYGALSNETGRVHINWRREQAPDGPQFELEWREEGGPPVSEPDRKGFGQTMLFSHLALAFSGKVDLDYATAGLQWRLVAPAERLSN